VTTTVDGWAPDLHWLANHLAVGGCFPADRARQLVRDHNIRAVIDLRDEDRDDEAALSAAGVRFLHLPTRDLHVGPPEMLDHGVGFAREHVDRGDAVLIHCTHGIGRSPVLALCVMVDLGMEPLQALEQAKSRRVQVSPSEMQYRGWAEWLRHRGCQVPDYHSFGCIAYRHLAQA
jgi:protein-tyrosine phosphatase